MNRNELRLQRQLLGRGMGRQPAGQSVVQNVVIGRDRPRGQRPTKADQPSKVIKQQRARRTLSEAGRTALAIVQRYVVYRGNDGSGHYWLDYWMHGVRYIEAALLKELRKLKLIREVGRVFVAS